MNFFPPERHRPDPLDHWEIEIDSGFAGSSDLGCKRLNNEDYMAAGLNGRCRVAIICDGISGSEHAEAAAQLAAPLLLEDLKRLPATRTEPSTLEQAITRALNRAHAEIMKLSPKCGDEAPATTVLLAVVYENQITLSWLGDCRGYWLPAAPAEARLLTKDHSWVNEMVDSGKLSYEEAIQRKGAGALTKNLGGDAVTRDQHLISDVPSFTHFTPQTDGWLLLCTDGLWNYEPKAEAMDETVSRLEKELDPSGLPTALQLANALILHVKNQGAKDNVSLLLLKINRNIASPAV